MVRLDSLPTELLLSIVEFLDPPADFATVDPYPGGPPPLKSISLCSKRLHSLCFPHLFRSVCLVLEADEAVPAFDRLLDFLSSHELRNSVERVAVKFGHKWNENKIGIRLKAFLCRLEVRSLSLHQDRGDITLGEKAARWPHYLTKLEKLRVHEIDDEKALKMILLRECPIHFLEISDGDPPRSAWGYENHYDRPGVGFLKHTLFPNLTHVSYTSDAPTTFRFYNVLHQFLKKLPALKHLTVQLMSKGEKRMTLQPANSYFGFDDTRKNYQALVSMYRILCAEVERWHSLEYFTSRDKHWIGPVYFQAPRSYVEISEGAYRRNAVAVEVYDDY